MRELVYGGRHTHPQLPGNKAMTEHERIECQLRGITVIARWVEEAKSELTYGTKAWNKLDLAEARLRNLSMFTSFGRRETKSN
jgi:hypothetical protein